VLRQANTVHAFDMHHHARLTCICSVLTGDHDWVKPSDELLASLREELDLDLRDAPDDSDDGGSRAGEGGPTKKCRPWHWLQEMRYAT